MRCTLLLVVSLLLAACGGGDAKDDAPPAAGPGRWHVAEVEGVSSASGVAVAGEGLLVVADQGAQRVFVLPRPVDGSGLAAQPLAVDLDRESRLSGGEEFTSRGYRLGDLWERATDLCGVALQAPDHVFLLERAYRVIYAGRVVYGRDGLPTTIRLQRAFTVPGADRSKSDASDWRDFGPGTEGLASVRGKRLDDLFVLERGAEDATTFRVRSMDRYGSQLEYFDVGLGGGLGAAVAGLAHEDKRFLVLRGEGRGLLTPFREGRWKQVVKAGKSVPGPELESGASWQGIASGEDGTLYLVGGGETCRLAWRRP